MRVSLFVTCLADSFAPRAAVSAVRVLRRLGVEVDAPEGQTCCGQPAWNAGHTRDARAVAAHFLDVFDAALASSDYVVSPSGSCASMVHHYPDLFREDAARYGQATRVAERTLELTQFLVDVLGVSDPLTDLGGVRVAYHDSCHAMRGLGVHAQPRALLTAAGATILPWDESCCGFGGLFSVKMPELSEAMMNRKLGSLAVDAIGADVLTSTDLGCLLQLGGGLKRAGRRVPVVHVAELLERGANAWT